ncbi:MAG: hypothetical protein Q7T81_14715 [Pseudolabrys sp.]|nr:hypothetical protein [Pseudolabrys sp.]
MFRARIRIGRPQFPARLPQFCEEHEGRWLRIELEEPVRSISQNRMYRAWLDNVAESTGNNAEELHEFLLHKLAPRLIVTIKGDKGVVEVEQIKRTSAMSKADMVEYMDKCAALTGYPLPTPEELMAMGYLPH